MDQMDQIDSLVVQLKSSDQNESLENLINSLEKLSELCKKLINLGPQYDWKDLPHNGCRSIVKLFILFTNNVIQPSLKSKKINMESLVGVINLLIEMSKRAIIFSQETETPPEKIVENIVNKLFIGTKQHFPDIEPHVKYYWGHHAFFWIKSSSLHFILRMIRNVVFIDDIPKYMFASNEECGTFLTSFTWKTAPLLLLNIINCSNNVLSRAFNSLFCIVNGIEFKKFFVPRQSKWIVPDDGSRIKKPSYESVNNNLPQNSNIIEQNQNAVQCFLMKSKSLVPSGDVILHASGGGFIIDARQVHEAYLRDWVQRLDGAAIINVIYSRCVRYPCALQELIDVYFWLTKGGEDVIKILGFKPQRIICLGDSAGFLLLLTMCCAVRDIQLVCPSEVSLYPEALMGMSPLPSSGTQTIFPSLLLSYVDLILSPTAILQAIALYSTGVIFDFDCFDMDSYNENSDMMASSPLWLNPPTTASFYTNKTTWIKQSKSWHDCDPTTLRTRANKIASRLMPPYISPLISYDFNAISDLKLVLISSEFDSFLDMNIELAKKWKGKLSLDVIENMPHGFYGLYSLNEECYKATEFCFQKLKDICC